MKGVKTGGRTKGTPNKAGTIKEHFERVFNALQKRKDTCLKAWAEKNPSDFYKLAHRLIPQQIDANMKHTYGELVQEAAKEAEAQRPDLKVIQGGRSD